MSLLNVYSIMTATYLAHVKRLFAVAIYLLTRLAFCQVRKTYFTLAFCDICRGLLLSGFR